MRILPQVNPAEISIDPESKYRVVAHFGQAFDGAIRGILFRGGVAYEPITGPVLRLPGLLHLVHVFPWEPGTTVLFKPGEDPVAFLDDPAPVPVPTQPERTVMKRKRA